jgi:hypothetical protein
VENSHTGHHKAVKVTMGGLEVEVDEGIVDFVMWLNKIPGVETTTSCQGGYCTEGAFVQFTSIDPKWVDEIIAFVTPWANVNEIKDGRYRIDFEKPENLIEFMKARSQEESPQE